MDKILFQAAQFKVGRNNSLLVASYVSGCSARILRVTRLGISTARRHLAYLSKYTMPWLKPGDLSIPDVPSTHG